jgi:hypothetical protein
MGPSIPYLGNNWGRVVSFMPRPRYPKRNTPGTHSTEDWADPITGLDAVEKSRLNTTGTPAP